MFIPKDNETVQQWATRMVLEERAKQDGKWGEQNHEPSDWLAILLEEVGEFSRRALDRRFGSHSMHHLKPCSSCGDMDGCHVPMNLQAELVQVAAVALAMLECSHRNKWCKEPARDRLAAKGEA